MNQTLLFELLKLISDFIFFCLLSLQNFLKLLAESVLVLLELTSFIVKVILHLS